jgi:hypothetical protein
MTVCAKSEQELALALQFMYFVWKLMYQISMKTMSFTAVFSNKPLWKLRFYFHILRYLCGHFPTIHHRINPSTGFCWACSIQLSPPDYTHQHVQPAAGKYCASHRPRLLCYSQEVEIQNCVKLWKWLWDDLNYHKLRLIQSCLLKQK